MIVRGELVELRAIERQDLPRYALWLNDSDVQWYLSRMEPTSLDEETRWHERLANDPQARDYAIWYQGEHIGGAGFTNLNFKERSGEVRLMIGRKDLWDRGLGADALLALLRHGFEQLNLHRVCLHVFSDNARAIRCYEKVGFRQESRQRECSFRHGRYHDMLWMSILEDEYRSGQAGAPAT
jgi:diamine N-acetyltransferase